MKNRKKTKGKTHCAMFSVLLLCALAIIGCGTGLDITDESNTPIIDEPGNPAIIEEKADLIDMVRPVAMSSAISWAIIMKPLDENVTLNCAVDNGVFSTVRPAPGDALYAKNMDVKSVDIIKWIGQERINNGHMYLKPASRAFVEIIIKLEQNIIGYIVIEFNLLHSRDIQSYILKSVLFPQVNGEYQEISEEYVKTAIEKIKADAKLVRLSGWRRGSGLFNRNKLIMSYPDENVVFNCTVDNGSLYSRRHSFSNQLKNLSARYGDEIHWYEWDQDATESIIHAFIEVVLELEDYIIGYVVIEAYQLLQDFYCDASIIKSVLFPQTEGEYQKINKEDVKAEIEKVKAEAREGDL